MKSMTSEDYHARRAKLLSEFNRLKRLRLMRSAAARVRMIADLDYNYDGTPRKRTLAVFHYDEINPDKV